MENKKTQKIVIYGVIVCTLILVGFLGSYAYFISTPNVKHQEVSVETGNLSLIFEDGNAGINEEVNFGSSITKTFTIENNGSLDATAVMYFDNLVNTYTLGSLTYTLSYSETEDGTYTELITDNNVPRSKESASRILTNNLSIPAQQKYYYKLTITLNYLSDVDQTADLNAIFSSNFKLEEAEERSLETLKSLGLKAKEGKPDFVVAATTDETADGLYSLDDDYGTSYYYRGAVTNNYVKFGEFYWRIIRINGDGSVRIMYDGTIAHENNDVSNERGLTNMYWSSTHNDNKYIGYMYGGSEGTASNKRINLGQEGYEDSTNAIYNETNSNMKIQLEDWYKTNIYDKGLDEFVSDEIFCNDRSTPGKDTGYSNDTGLGYGKAKTAYGANMRSAASSLGNSGKYIPLFKCDKNDAFTVNETENGNGKLSYKVGLITMDEAWAGGTGDWQHGSVNTNNYLYRKTWYWTMSPCHYYSNSSDFMVIINNGQFFNKPVNDSSGLVIPVINLTPEYIYQMIGDGTIGNEYRVE